LHNWEKIAIFAHYHWANKGFPNNTAYNMKWLLLIIAAITFLPTEIYPQGGRWELFEVIDTIPIRKGTNRKLYKDIENWYGKTRATKIVRANPNTMNLEGKSYFVYFNKVVIEDIFLSPRAGERTTGAIQYEVSVQILDSVVIAKASNFQHEAYYSPYGSISFGVITAYETVPPGRCLENPLWCNSVWAEMKQRCDVADKISKLVPESAQRREGRVYRVREEVPVEVKEEAADPRGYLNLDNYIIKEETE
jgi:hypothetical protein